MLAMDNCLPGLADGAAGERLRRADGSLFYVPSVRGTESLVVNEANELYRRRCHHRPVPGVHRLQPAQ